MAKKSTTDKALKWIVSDDTGCSSETLWATMMGTKSQWSMHPSDPADIGRCFRLLALIPEWKKRLPEMSRVSPEWRALVKHWGKVEALMTEEVGIDWSKGQSAPRTYWLMKQILDPVEQRRHATTA